MALERGNRLWKVLAAAATTVVAFNSYQTYHVNEKANEARDDARAKAIADSVQRDERIRQGQIQNCYIIGEPIRHAQIRDAKNTVADIKRQRQQSKTLDYHKLFPNFNPEKLHKLIQQGKARQQRTITAEQSIIDTLQNVPPCEQRYPPVSESPQPQL